MSVASGGMRPCTRARTSKLVPRSTSASPGSTVTANAEPESEDGVRPARAAAVVSGETVKAMPASTAKNRRNVARLAHAAVAMRPIGTTSRHSCRSAWAKAWWITLDCK